MTTDLDNLNFKTVAICGLDSTLGCALRDALELKGCDIINIKESDLHIPPINLAEKIQPADGIINLYGEPFIAKWEGRYEFDIYKSRLEGLRALGLAIKYTIPHPHFFITISNAMVYDKFEVHDEYSTIYGDNFMAEVGKMETDEAIKIDAQHFNNMRLIIARMGYLMSPFGGAFPLLSSLAKIGWGGRVDDGFQCLPMIHVHDAVNSLLFIANNPQLSGIFNLSIPQMASMNELVIAFTNSTLRSQHRLPKFIIKLLTGRAINLLEQNCKVLPKRLLQNGFIFKYANVDAIVSNLQQKTK